MSSADNRLGGNPQDEIFASSFAAAAYLKSIGFNKKAYIVGEVGIQKEMDIAGISHMGGPVSASLHILSCTFLPDYLPRPLRACLLDVKRAQGEGTKSTLPSRSVSNFLCPVRALTDTRRFCSHSKRVNSPDAECKAPNCSSITRWQNAPPLVNRLRSSDRLGCGKAHCFRRNECFGAVRRGRKLRSAGLLKTIHLIPP